MGWIGGGAVGARDCHRPFAFQETGLGYSSLFPIIP
jgi:hypothetical protein